MSIDSATVLDAVDTVVTSFIAGAIIIGTLWLAATTVMLAVHNPVGLLALFALLLVPTSLGYVALTLRDWL